ncbi:MAG TPA: Na+/H+ antiporter NhaA [Acidimicrobiales bacterium]|nr:Na+/H+ antiporter NhaA [Acidimicrobiales bacterium]
MSTSNIATKARSATPARSLPGLVHRFIETEASSGLVLVGATVVALVWANSPWHHLYETLWHNPIVIQAGGLRIAEDLRHFVNDGLMALFFFVVALEIKREVVRGELADVRVAALPVFAAVGGMIVPASLYLVATIGSGAQHGWGIPMATDIAFALGVLALVSPRLPGSLKVLLLTLAIVDDIGAIIVIAVFYGGRLDLVALAAAVGFLAIAAVLIRVRIDWPPLYAALAVAAWYATYRSGVHATIAGVAFGLLTPARALAPSETVRRWALDLSDEPGASEVRQMMVIARESVSPAEHLEVRLHPFTSFVVLPCFALANAGVVIHRDMLGTGGARAVAAGVVVGLVVGKAVGILAGSWAATRLRLAALPEGVTWAHVAGIAALGGIGFTVSLFIAGLAFDDPQLADAAKLAILVASTAAALIGTILLRRASTERPAAALADA